MVYFAGAAEMFLATRQHPAVMRDEIVSPAGTTSYANHQLEKGGFKNTIINAVEAATLRYVEWVQNGHFFLCIRACA